MTSSKRLKITVIGAGSVSFAPASIRDILLNDRINSVELDIQQRGAGHLPDGHFRERIKEQ
jgi:hypothetical protein